MRLRLFHRTEYQYATPVTESVNELRLSPPTSRFQNCEAHTIAVLPACRLTQYEDLFVNRVHHFELPEPHSRLVIESRATVSTRCKVDFDSLPYGFQHSDLHLHANNENCYPYLQDSTYIERSPRIWRKALDIQGFSTDVFQTSYQIMEYIFDNFEYDSGSTTVSTHASEVIESGKGVCQDFAHAMVALCRSIGIPARYVSGYFYDSTRANNLRGSGASHAWVEVFIADFGWIGFDPTNNKVIDETYIILAQGRDYRDVAPVTGVYTGSGRSSMTVKVQVDRLDAPVPTS